MIGMPVPPDEKVNLRTALFCGAFAHCKNAQFSGKICHEPGHGRNLIIQDAIKNTLVTHIFFLDADVAPPDTAIADLLAMDKDIAAGVYPMMFDNKKCWSASIEADEKKENYKWLDYDKLPDRPFPTWAIAAGGMLVKRRVLEKIAAPWFEYEYRPDGGRLGEDIHFTNKAITAEFSLWTNPKVICGHHQTRDIL